MKAARAAIIEQIKKDILPLEGYRPALHDAALDVGLRTIKNAFPNNQFPLGAIHEFISNNSEETAATIGFITGLLSSLMKKSGAAIWVGDCSNIYPPALKAYGISPHMLIFIQLKKEKEILWAIEEALKCNSLSAVVGMVPDLSFIASRRLQLAVEQSQVTGFILRQNPKNLVSGAFVARWHITPLPGELPTSMPGVGFPTWNVGLLKVRNGKSGNWRITFAAGRFRHGQKMVALPKQVKTKTG